MDLHTYMNVYMYSKAARQNRVEIFEDILDFTQMKVLPSLLFSTLFLTVFLLCQVCMHVCMYVSGIVCVCTPIVFGNLYC